MLALSWPLEPNANSLHRLYRDRLSDAFISAVSAAPSGEGCSLDTMKLSEINADRTPYLLVNSALNIEGSSYVNKRARNADFFVFSRDYIGSHATGYVPTTEMERRLPALDLATAMAISGAAASPNMGAQSLRILTPTLALLNIRLGYWMPNPSLAPDAIDRRGKAPKAEHRGLTGSWLRDLVFNKLYLAAEMLSLLDETSPKVYLTDGGHIENLGIYELLKRRCRIIIAVDAEADPTLFFPSFVTLQRFARIDLGIRIDLPWQEIRERNIACANEVELAAGTGKSPTRLLGSHVAVGTIQYPNAPNGWLIYIKSSLTGDEGDLILDYKRRYGAFPHETTGDQFFGEAQFEAYRALGFHATMGLVTGRDYVPGLLLPGQDEAYADTNAPGVAQKRLDRLKEIFG